MQYYYIETLAYIVGYIPNTRLEGIHNFVLNSQMYEYIFEYYLYKLRILELEQKLYQTEQLA